MLRSSDGVIVSVREVDGAFYGGPLFGGGFSSLYDRYTWKVDARECARFCRPDQLAEVMSATDIAGVITQRAAEATGLVAGTPVLVGTGDSGAEAISTGVFRPGDMMVQLGSTAYFIYLADHMVDDARLWPWTFIIPELTGSARGPIRRVHSHRGYAKSCIATP